MKKIKITNKSSGKITVVSPEDAKAIQKNPLISKKYKFEKEEEVPSEPLTKSEEPTKQSKTTKTNNK